MSDVFVVRDDTSSSGLRRLRLLASGPIDVESYLQQACEQGEVELWLYWQDEELGHYHLYLCWRLAMLTNAKMWARGIGSDDFQLAVGKAAQGYHQRFGDWPNRVIVRENGQELPEAVPLVEANKEDGVSEIERVKVVPLKKDWQPGLVGVYREVEEDEGS